jgi:hypothetical protein
MTTHAYERDAEKIKFYAACHGAGVDEPTGETAAVSGNLPTDRDPRFKGCIPGDPKSYAHLPEELQREFLEKRMEEDRQFFSQAFRK